MYDIGDFLNISRGYVDKVNYMIYDINDTYSRKIVIYSS